MKPVKRDIENPVLERRMKLKEKFPDQKKFIIKANPDFLLEHYKKLKSPELCDRPHFVTLHDIAVVYNNPGAAHVFVLQFISSLNKFLNLRVKLDPDQGKMLAKLICRNNPHLNTADVTLVFSRIMMGEYGKGEMYGVLETQKIAQWFDLYRREKGKIRVKKQQDAEMELFANTGEILKYVEENNPSTLREITSKTKKEI